MGITKEIQLNCDQKCKCMDEQPKKSKMRVLKKIKKRIGLGSSSKSETCTGQSILPPLRFHHIHGENIQIARNGTLAKRYEGYNKGITFSDRPVHPNERITVNIAETAINWSGVIRFGFTVIDPETFHDPTVSRNTLPKHACPDLTNRHGFWAKALDERYCDRANVLTIYFTSSGDVHYGINGVDKGVFFKMPPTHDPLWLLFDVYGNCSSIEFINQRGCSQQNRSGSRLSLPAVAASGDEVDGIVPHMQSMSVNEINRPLPGLPRSRSVTSLRPSLAAVSFHRTRGQSIHLSEDRYIATRVDNASSQGYVFTARPIRIGERLIIQVLRTEPKNAGGLTLGLTACDPASLHPCDLPNDAESLLDRPEYWVVSKNIISNLVRGDQIIFSITSNGEVYITKNNGPANAIMQVDRDIQLWAFLDIFGSMQSIRVVSQMPQQTTLRQASVSTAVLPSQRIISRPYASQYLRPAEPISLRPSESMGNIGMRPAQISQSTQSMSIPTTSTTVNRCIPNSEMIQLHSGTATVLVVNIPPSGSSNDISVTSQTHQTQSTQMLIPSPARSPSHNTYATNYVQTTPTKQASPQKHRPLSQWQDGQTECAICCENPIDSALYSCGHMCMCYECAQEQWHGAGGGQCPLCRAVIRDVIRIYKS